jgi:DNA-binding transcriptional ArsR family regulator
MVIHVNVHPCGTFFDMLSTRSRIEIIRSLHRGEKSVGEICKSVGTDRTNVSHQLRLLRECGFVFARREGKKKIYSLNSETVKPILDLAEKHVEKYCKLKLARKPPCSARSS